MCRTAPKAVRLLAWIKILSSGQVLCFKKLYRIRHSKGTGKELPGMANQSRERKTVALALLGCSQSWAGSALGPGGGLGQPDGGEIVIFHLL